MTIKDYATRDLIVSYDATRCIHAAECVRGAPNVFDPTARPWIRVENADPDYVAEVVQRCPTGALTARGLVHSKAGYWGGGSPTFLSPDEIRKLGEIIHQHFTFAPDMEAGVEVDPRRLTRDHIVALREIGFNRASLGVQDFDPAVQQAVGGLAQSRKPSARGELSLRGAHDGPPEAQAGGPGDSEAGAVHSHPRGAPAEELFLRDLHCLGWVVTA